MSARQQTSALWTNEGDNSPLQGLDSAFLPNQEAVTDLNFAAYGCAPHCDCVWFHFIRE